MKPIVITRGNVAQIASLLGGAGLLIGIIGFVWTGAMTVYVGAALIVGILGIALWASMTPREFMGFITGRQARRSTTGVFTTLLLIGVVALVYILLQRNTLTLDMTVAQRFTLSSETLAVLRRVSKPIRITAFYTSRNLPVREVDDQFFRLYEAETNGLISRQYIDPDEQPALAQRYGVTTDGQTFISFLNADGSTDLTSLARIPRAEENANQERDITEAIARLLLSGSMTGYFDVGLGERDPNDTSSEGTSRIAGGMQESGLVVYTISIPELAAQGQDIPADAATVVLARPLTDLNEAEIGVIDRYLNRGGSLLIMADVLFSENPFLQQNGAFNTYLWENYGIRALDAAVVDPAASGQTPLDVISAVVYPDTDLGKRLDPSSNPTLFHIARPIEVNLNNSPPDIINGQVIQSSTQSYGETDLKTLGETNVFGLDSADLPPPLTTVAWAFNQQTNAKIVLVGDSDFVSNGQVLTGGNAVLFTDCIAWLSGLGEKISFLPQSYGVGVPLIFVSAQTFNLISFLTIILLPGAVLVTGIAVWMRRARR